MKNLLPVTANARRNWLTAFGYGSALQLASISSCNRNGECFRLYPEIYTKKLTNFFEQVFA
ncbi:MAG: hypothetical protein H8E28_14030 [Anaerolineae bacterium]|nr:hypothetical protein [Anaerolineae bacterium]